VNELRYTLLTDGSSDRAFIPLITWLFRQCRPLLTIQSQWADLRRLHNSPKKLAERIRASIELYPCELLFIHRDAEREDPNNRIDEIKKGLQEAKPSIPHVCIVPVRMQEAWLLFDEVAIRQAAGNPNGKQTLNLPLLSKTEQLPDPKQVLHELLREASGLSTTRRQKFSAERAALLVTEYIEDFTPLRQLSAFQALENDLAIVLQQLLDQS
jgi:hypothetical protein